MSETNGEQIERAKEEVREETRQLLRRGAYFYFIMIATVLLSAGASIGITISLTQRSERKLCAVVVTTDDAYHRNPPGTPAGREQAANFTTLRRDLGCPPFQEVR